MTQLTDLCAQQDQVRLHVGLYAVYLRHWLEAFDRDQVLVLRTEDYKRNITESLGALFNHLDIGACDTAVR